MSDEPEDYDLLAATYVLGAMEPDEAHAFELLTQEHHELASAVEAWRNRLAPLAMAVHPVQPPSAVWERVTATLGMEAGNDPLAPPPITPEREPIPLHPLRRAWRSASFWRASTAGAIALAAAFAAVTFLGRTPPPAYLAALTPVNAPGPIFLASGERDGGLLITPVVHPSVPNGKDLELWVLLEGATQPRSLGVLPAIGRRAAAGQVPPGSKLLVSAEPIGGSPSRRPSGPVLYAGTVVRVE